MRFKVTRNHAATRQYNALTADEQARVRWVEAWLADDPWSHGVSWREVKQANGGVKKLKQADKFRIVLTYWLRQHDEIEIIIEDIQVIDEDDTRTTKRPGGFTWRGKNKTPDDDDPIWRH